MKKNKKNEYVSFAEEQREFLKASKKKATIRAGLSLLESVASATLTGVCAAVTYALVTDDATPNSTKSIALGTTAIAVGLTSKRILDSIEMVDGKIKTDRAVEVATKGIELLEKYTDSHGDVNVEEIVSSSDNDKMQESTIEEKSEK